MAQTALVHVGHAPKYGVWGAIEERLDGAFHQGGIHRSQGFTHQFPVDTARPGKGQNLLEERLGIAHRAVRETRD